jgi:C1A family cysteine protease
VARRTGKVLALGALLATAAAALALLVPAAYAAAGGRLAPADPSFLHYLDGRGSARNLGLVPAPVSSAGVPRAHLAPITARSPRRYVASEVAASVSPRAESGAQPAAYDLRTLDKLSPIRDQGRWGTCWAFAALGSLESSQLPSSGNDYSENNLANRAGFALGYGDGGNSFMAAAYLLRWDGPVAETDDPYAPGASVPNPSPADAAVRAHVHEVLDLPARTSSTDNADLKWAVMTYGAVYATMYWSDSAYRVATRSYYYTGSGANHAVDIVGWDDTYSAANFAAAPVGPGAFLVRNSWGAGFGSAGYFWVSYYDVSLGRQSVVFAGAEPASADERIYQHDPLGWVASYRPPAATDPTTAWLAAAYTAAEDGTLTAAGFYATAPGATYEVRVGGTVAALKDVAVAASGTLTAAGYHTVTLGSPVAVTAGQPLVIAVRLTTPGYGFPVAVERPYPGYANATASAGQSFVSGDGVSWTDMTTLIAGTDVCLKGYGTATGVPDQDPTPDPAVTPTPAPQTRAKPSVTVRGGSGGAGSLVRVAFRVKRTGAATTADVRFRLQTARGRVVRHQTMQGVDVTIGHTWSVRTPARRGAYVVVAVATLDTGEVSRPATATVRVR